METQEYYYIIKDQACIERFVGQQNLNDLVYKARQLGVNGAFKIMRLLMEGKHEKHIITGYKVNAENLID
jgi:hypothetical protein